jgi:hypothetical protein
MEQNKKKQLKDKRNNGKTNLNDKTHVAFDWII